MKLFLAVLATDSFAAVCYCSPRRLGATARRTEFDKLLHYRLRTVVETLVASIRLSELTRVSEWSEEAGRWPGC